VAQKSKFSWYTNFERAVFYLALIILGFWLFQQLNLLDLTAEIISFWDWGDSLLTIVEPSTETMLLPTLIVTGMALLIMQIFPNKPPKWAKVIVSTITLILGIRYIVWRLFSSLNFHDPLNASFSITLFVLECLAFLVSIGSLVHMSWTINRSAQADVLSQAVLDGTYTPSVDVYIPTYNEPPELLRRTIIGCQALDYPNKQIYLLDDKRRPPMKELAEELGCIYVCRPDNSHAKAGNLNHALKKTNGDLIVVFDADFIPTRNFLIRTVGFFQDPKIALVQTPQNFYNGDPIKHNLGLGTLMTNDQDMFFRLLQEGRDATNCVICCGSCFIIRRSALEEIGGIPTDTLCEDLLTSLQLQAANYRVIYLNEAISAGASAENIGGYIDQRLRWGQGTLQTLFCRINPITMRGLGLMQRFFFGLVILGWCMAGFQFFFLLVPLGYMLFGLRPIETESYELIYFWFPYYVINLLVFTWLNGGRRSAFWGDVYTLIMSFPAAIMVFKTFMRPFSKGFKVTPKGVDAQGVTCNWQVAMPLIITLLLYILAIALHLLGIEWDAKPETPAFSIFWAIYSCFVLIVTIQVTIDVPQEVLALRFHHQLPCQLIVGKQKIRATTIELSQKGTVIRFVPRVLPTQIPAHGLLDIPIIGLRNVEVDLKHTTTDATGVFDIELEFTDLTIEQERPLIEFLFCRPGQWQEIQMSEVKSLFALIASIFRFYPLVEASESNFRNYTTNAQVIVGQFIDKKSPDSDKQRIAAKNKISH
jgi:cellulose synthase (UDP-forming)